MSTPRALRRRSRARLPIPIRPKPPSPIGSGAADRPAHSPPSTAPARKECRPPRPLRLIRCNLDRARSRASRGRSSPAWRSGPASAAASAKTAALGVGLAAAFGLALGGFFVAENEPPGGLVTKIAYLLHSPKGEGLIRPRRAVAGSALPQEAVALNPTLTARPGGQGGEVAALYAAAVARLEANDDQGVDALRHAADLGYPPAQFYLAKLYETGANGVAKDAVQARLWTQRAAAGGDARAMHNLALYEYEGAGGQKNVAAAAAWFRRAASLGLVDSQYNLGRLYESGVGVAQNTAEAYKWYLIASSSGDSESKSAAARVRAGLSPDAPRSGRKGCRRLQTGGGAGRPGVRPIGARRRRRGHRPAGPLSPRLLSGPHRWGGHTGAQARP